MVRSHAGRGALLSSNLPQLQNLIKRDPQGYKDEFFQQWNHYQSTRKIFVMSPDGHSSSAQSFREMVTFISQVAQCYPAETKDFPAQISALLLEEFGSLDSDTRKCLVSNLVILRKKEVIESIDLLKCLFPLLPRATSSTLRSYIRKNILTDIRTANLKRKNHKLNRAVQAILFRMVEQDMLAEHLPTSSKGKQGVKATNPTSEDAMWAIFLTKDLWAKGVWDDAKTVSIIALGCFHPNVKVQSASLHFFEGVEDEVNSSDEEDDDGPSVGGLLHRRDINKKTRSGDKKTLKTIKAVKKKNRNKKKDSSNTEFTALHLLQDPQTFAEKLYDNLLKNDKRNLLDQKILIMQVLSRAIGLHKLCVLGFFSYIIKYLTYHQLQIPTILASLAQAVHELTPPDELTPVIRKIAQEFVHPGVGSEVIASGLNAVREICRRQPWCMEEDLLADLVEYKKSKDKGIMTASRSLLHLYRQTMPSMLKRRDRGKEASMKISIEQPLQFGEKAQDTSAMEGFALLEKHQREMDVDGEPEAWDGWEVDSESDESSSASEGWIDVSSDEEDIVISDSEDENEETREKDQEEQLNLADVGTTKIFTPADFAMLEDLRSKAQSESTSTKKRKHHSSKTQPSTSQFLVSEGDILGPRKKAKADYEERMESIMKGRESREKFGSSKGKKSKEAPSSSTNREKARNKPLMMVMASAAVRGKKKASLREKQKRLRAHADNSKKRR